jgi:hypothetical protein
MKNQNLEKRVFFDKTDPLFIFFPNLDIKELIKYDESEYTKLREENRRQMEKW